MISLYYEKVIQLSFICTVEYHSARNCLESKRKYIQFRHFIYCHHPTKLLDGANLLSCCKCTPIHFQCSNRPNCAAIC